MKKRSSGSAALAMAVVAILTTTAPAPVTAQTQGGTVQGRVTADDGSPLADVTATITRVGGEARQRIVRTNANGEFESRFLPPGRYRVQIDLEGFRGVEREIEVRSKQTTRFDVELDLDAGVVDERSINTRDGSSPGEGEPGVRLFERTRADGSTSLGVGVDGWTIDDLEIGLPSKLRGRFEPGYVQPDWIWEDRGSASGPAASVLRLRLDGPAGAELPGKLKLEGSLGGERVFSGKYPVERLPAVDPTKVPYLGLPGVIVPGELVLLTPPLQDGVVVRASNDGWAAPIEFGDPPGHGGEDSDSDSDSGSDSGSDSDSDSDSGDGGGGHSIGAVVPYGDLSGPIRVTGVDSWGESIFTYDWSPLDVSPGLCAGGTKITGASDLNFAGQQLCVCGCFGSGIPTGLLQIGGRVLGRPTGSSPYVANFNTPGDLAPGTYEVGWAPGSAGAGGPFPTQVIEIRASINDEVIQKGGTTGLEMEIVGTDRALPVELHNLSPNKIEMKPANTIQTESTGGPDRNHVPGVTVTGRKTGTYYIDWKVDAGECPCGDTLPEIEKIWEQEVDKMLIDLDSAEPPAVAPGDAATGAAGTASRDGSCGGGLQLGDGRWTVEIDWGAMSGDGSCRPYPPNGALLGSPGATQWEILAKVVDGCRFNDHFWVFYAATTDVEYTLQVTDTASGDTRSYGNTLGRAPAIVDTSAFATCP